MAWNEPGNNGDDKDPWGGGRRGNNDGPPDIEEVLKNLSNNKALRNKIGTAGREKIKRLFSREIICKKYEQLFVDLFDRRGI